MFVRSALAALTSLCLVAGAAAQTMTIPLVADFEAPEHGAFFDFVAGELGGTVADGNLAVASTRDAGSGSLSIVNLDTAGGRAVFADVSARFSRPGGELIDGAGIVIRHRNDASGVSFFALVLVPDGYLVSAWANGGLTQSGGGSLPAGSGDTVRLAARETADGAEFFVNGTSVASLSDGGVTGSGLGLAVFGSGDFAFDNYGPNGTGDIGDGTAAPAATPSAAVWYVEEAGQPIGPLTADDIAARIADGRMTGATLVWRAGMPDWVAASAAPDLVLP
jgi:hypothetical protein